MTAEEVLVGGPDVLSMTDLTTVADKAASQLNDAAFDLHAASDAVGAASDVLPSALEGSASAIQSAASDLTPAEVMAMSIPDSDIATELPSCTDLATADATMTTATASPGFFEDFVTKLQKRGAGIGAETKVRTEGLPDASILGDVTEGATDLAMKSAFNTAAEASDLGSDMDMPVRGGLDTFSGMSSWGETASRYATMARSWASENPGKAAGAAAVLAATGYTVYSLVSNYRKAGRDIKKLEKRMDAQEEGLRDVKLLLDEEAPADDDLQRVDPEVYRIDSPV